MPTSGSHFTAQAPLLPVFFLGLLATNPDHKDVSLAWFEKVVQTPVRSVCFFHYLFIIVGSLVLLRMTLPLLLVQVKVLTVLAERATPVSGFKADLGLDRQRGRNPVYANRVAKVYRHEEPLVGRPRRKRPRQRRRDPVPNIDGHSFYLSLLPSHVPRNPLKINHRSIGCPPFWCSITGLFRSGCGCSWD